MIKSIRQLVQEAQNEIAKGNLMPARAAELLTQLAALGGSISEELIKRDMEYNKTLLGLLESELKASHAKIKAECSEEYRLKREAYATRDLNTELIRSLKYFLKVWERELQEAKYQ